MLSTNYQEASWKKKNEIWKSSHESLRQKFPQPFWTVNQPRASRLFGHRFLLIESALLPEIINGQKNTLTNNPPWVPQLAGGQKAEGQCLQSPLFLVQIFPVASSLGLTTGLNQNIWQVYLSGAFWLTAKLFCKLVIFSACPVIVRIFYTYCNL